MNRQVGYAALEPVLAWPPHLDGHLNIAPISLATALLVQVDVQFSAHDQMRSFGRNISHYG